MNSKSYFKGINYSLANEDTLVEQALIPHDGASVVTVCGSGSRVLPLLSRKPSKLVVRDLSPEQLKLFELRLAALKTLDYDEFLFFLGYRGSLPSHSKTIPDRFALFEKLDLSSETRVFWQERKSAWTPQGLIWLGRWESHFKTLSKIFQNVMRINAEPIFAAQTLAAQREMVKKHWRPRLFHAFVRVALSDTVFNKFLYKGAYAGATSQRTAAEPAWKLVENEFKRMLDTTLVRRNFFLQMMLLGELRFEEGLPAEAQAKVFEAAKRGASTAQVVIEQGDILSACTDHSCDFASLSDTVSYMPAEHAASLLAKMHHATPSGARIVVRAFMRLPQIDLIPGWTHLDAAASQARIDDCTGVYQFRIYQKD